MARSDRPSDRVQTSTAYSGAASPTTARPWIGRAISIGHHQAAAPAPTADRSPNPTTGSTKQGLTPRGPLQKPELFISQLVQLLEQGPRLNEVRRVEALSERAVDWPQ